MKTRRIVTLLLVVLTLISALGMPILAADAVAAGDYGIAPVALNYLSARPEFDITDGTARLNSHFEGIEGVTTCVTVESKLQRKTIFGWRDVDNGQPDDTWVDYYYIPSGCSRHTLALSKEGSYRALITYTFSGTAGADESTSYTMYADY